MKTGAFVFFCLLTFSRAAVALDLTSSFSDATLLRVFLNNTDATLVSYGEPAVVGDRVVFSIPIPTTSGSGPLLQLVSIPFNRVDWDRTNHYAESARAARYFATRADEDYTRLSNDVAEALNEVTQTDDLAKRLDIAERARQKLAAWPESHYHYKQTEVQQMLGFLDEAINALGAATGRFSLALTTSRSVAPALEPLLPAPTLKEAIEQVLLATALVTSPVERNSLLAVALTELRRPSTLPADWVERTSNLVRAEIAEAVQTERAYQLILQRMTRLATERAHAADVRGVERLQAEAADRDAALGRQRPDMMATLLDGLEVQLAAARRLEADRARWATRVPFFRRYNAALRPVFEQFTALGPPLDDIRALSGSAPETLEKIQHLSGGILAAVSKMVPPKELEQAHALIVSAAQLAASAGHLRAESVESGNINRAWDASSAAAGSLMILSSAKSSLQSMLREPELP
jgi:hypothetical protein